MLLRVKYARLAFSMACARRFMSSSRLAEDRARGLQIGQGALEVWLHVARDQLIAVQHLLPRAPLGGRDQEAAEATALLVQTLDMRNQIIGCANAPGAAVHHLVDDLVGRTIEHRGEPDGLLEILALIASRLEARMRHSLFATVGQIDVHRHAPVFTTA